MTFVSVLLLKKLSLVFFRFIHAVVHIRTSFLFFFCRYCKVREILVPRPGIESRPALRAWNPNQLPGNSPLHFFLWLSNISLYGWAVLFIHSSTDGHLGYFRLLAIVTNGAMNIAYKGWCENLFSILLVNA